MNTRAILPLALIGFCAVSDAAESTPAKRPNILVIFSDDHAVRTISAYGRNAPVSTPNIDRIGNEGVVFERSFCANSICGPSRACVLTGRHSHANGYMTNGSRWNGNQPLFPQMLRDHGYRTALFGKWHLNGDPGREFDEWKVLSGAGGQGHYYNPDFKTKTKGMVNEHGFSTDIIARDALQWLDSARQGDSPFLLMVQFKAPHVHRLPAARHMSDYADSVFPVPETFFDDYRNRAPYAAKAWMRIASLDNAALNIVPSAAQCDPKDSKYSFLERLDSAQLSDYHRHYDPQNDDYRKRLASGEFSDPKAAAEYRYQRFLKDYLRCVAGIDDNVGRILDYLEAHGLDSNTVVVYGSDQSYFTGEHGWAEKRFMYEDALEMPLLVRWPGVVKAGSRPTQMVQNIDWAPTFLDIAGIAPASTMQGRSFKSILEGKNPDDWRRIVYYHYYEHGAHNVPRHEGVRTERYKLIHYYTDSVWEMFDFQADPLELRNIADDPNVAPVRQRLERELARLKRMYAVPDELYRSPYRLSLRGTE